MGSLLVTCDGCHRRTHARPKCLHLRVVGAEELGLRCRGSSARCRCVTVSRRRHRELAADHAGVVVLGCARIFPRHRTVRPAARLGRSRGASRVVDVPLQAHQQAGNAVLSPDGRSRDLHRGDDVSPRALAAQVAAERAQVRDDQRQGRPHSRAATRQVEVARHRIARLLAIRERGRAALGDRASCIRQQLGIWRQSGGSIHAGQFPCGLRRADARSRDLEHDPDRDGRWRDHRRVLHGDRLRDAST